MFQSLIDVARSIRVDLVEIYWILLVPLVCFLIVLELFKDGNEAPNAGLIIKRVVISILLLYSFEGIINVIGMVGDGVIGKINKLSNLKEVLQSLGPKKENLSNEWFNLREHILYVFSLLSYIVAYLGFFVAEVLTQFVWIILYTVSPLMILAYVPQKTANITGNLYKGLIKVIIWKILWTILGALLLKMAMEPQFTGLADYLMNIIMNLCIGLAMLFVPMATRSLINDGMESAASAMAAVPAMAAATTLKGISKKFAKSGANKMKDSYSFAGRPLKNLSDRGTKWMKAKTKYDERVGKNMERAKNWYSELGMNQEQKNLRRKSASKIEKTKNTYRTQRKVKRR